MAREAWKQKWVQQSEEVDDIEVVKEGNDDDDDDDDDLQEAQSHFMVLPHLAKDHQDALGALMTMLNMLDMDFLAFWQDSWNLSMSMLRAMDDIANELQRVNDLKKEMGKGKDKGKEKEEEPRRRTEDDDGDTDG
ncbi:hypothetical protein ID866_8961 [Astraeus odoratus]|nr:hypothetical protein ID866_8961 [Astraeus odoratus]